MLVLPKAWTKRWQGQDIFEKILALEGRVLRQKEGRKTLHFKLGGKYYFAKIHSGVGWNSML